jgi:diacylglycerol kinase (ATP)
MSDRFSLTARLVSFRAAARGLVVVVRTQHNAWIHLGATAAVLGVGFWLRLPRGAWLWLVVAMAGVWITEAFNTALEGLADAAVPDRHPLIRDAKDAAAGAVLVAAVAAASIGLMILGPPLWARLFGP